MTTLGLTGRDVVALWVVVIVLVALVRILRRLPAAAPPEDREDAIGAASPEDDPATPFAAVPFATEWEAEAAASALRERGIAAQVAGGVASGFRAEAPGMARLLVRPADLAQAKVILVEARDAAEAIDWDEADLGEPEAEPPRCPRCGYDLAGLAAPGCPECGWDRAGDVASS